MEWTQNIENIPNRIRDYYNFIPVAENKAPTSKDWTNEDNWAACDDIEGKRGFVLYDTPFLVLDFDHLRESKTAKMKDGVKEMLPRDFTTLAANQIKLFAHVDKMRILEFLILARKSCVSDIVEAVGIEQVKVSQYLKKLRDDGFVSSERDGRFIYYEITKGVHKTALQCIRHKFTRPGSACSL